jgi:uncharacterized membrane protein YqaE (UPF0057 family)
MASSTRKDLKPKRYHFYAVLLFILGTLFPPLGALPPALPPSLALEEMDADGALAAVAARFGIGTDFWLNLVLTICGYIPGEHLLFVVVCCGCRH